MAVQVFLLGHREDAALADVMRAFFGGLEKKGEGLLVSPWQEDLVLESRLVPPVSPLEVREASRSGRSDREVKVFTRLQGQAGGLEEEVPLHEVRRVLKRQVYVLLAEATGIHFPWGTLTGVRPGQIALELVRQKGKERAKEELIRTWRLYPEKARLVIETALAEEALLASLGPDECILYVGLPFCPSRCLYCSFISQDAGRQGGKLSPYVQAVIREASGIFSPDFPYQVRAVYYGGGTPTALPAALLGPYMEEVLTLAPLLEGAEMTMEAGRPDTIDREKLDLIRRAGFQRLCINPQTMHDPTLRLIGRGHTVAQTKEAFQLARTMGFDDINMDLIAGLPGEEGEDLLRSLEEVIRLGPDHITLHSLAVKKGSFLDRLLLDRDLLLPDPQLIESLQAAQDLLVQEGYRPYYLYKQKNCRSGLENTGFTRKEGSLYNAAMMSDQVPVVGLGSGSTSKIILEATARRLHNPKDLLVYMDRIDLQIDRKRALFSLPSMEADEEEVGPGEEAGMDMDGSKARRDDQV